MSVDIRDFAHTSLPGDDEKAIYIEDTFDQHTLQRLGASPSGKAILSPAKKWDDEDHCVSTVVADADRSMNSSGAGHYHRGGSSSAKKLRPHRTFAVELTNATQLFPAKREGSSGSVPRSVLQQDPYDPQSATSATVTPRLRKSQSAGATAVAHHPATQPETTIQMVPLSEYERLERDLRRFERMYAHQRSMAELSDQRTAEAQQKLQEKIVEVVALSTRNEESKRFIRQLKREMVDCKTRTLDLHNRAVMERTAEHRIKEKYTQLLEIQREEFAERTDEYERKIGALERLVADLTAVRDSGAPIEGLLKASYAKNHALFTELRRVRGEYERLLERKMEADRHADALRRERKELENLLSAEQRRCSHLEDAHETEVRQLQDSILDLRQDLVEALARVCSSPCSTTSVATENASDFDEDAHHAEYTVQSPQTADNCYDHALGEYHRDPSAERGKFTRRVPHAVTTEQREALRSTMAELEAQLAARNPLRSPNV